MAYLTVLRIPGAAGFFATTALGRLGVSMYGLSVILAAASGYDDYLRAGLVGGAFAASEAVGGPVVGRFVDRAGQRRALPLIAVAHLAALTGLVTVLATAAPVWLAALVAVAAGASVPQLGALAAARWSHLLHGDPRIDTAFSLESLANSAAFIAGPLAASGAVALLTPTAGVAAACVLVVGATLGLSAQRATMPAPQEPKGERPVWRTVAALGLANVLLGLLFGTTQLAVTALAREQDRVALAGVYYLTMSVGSLVASALYGTVRWTVPPWARLAGAGLLATIGAALMHLEPFTGLFVIGLGVGPVIILIGTLLEARVPKSRLTQAFALMSALSAAGIALSGLAGGAAVQAHGHTGGFALIIAYSCGLVLLPLLLRRTA
ncbi:MFS transporter [Dactylosporangium sp. CS-033363]|uniref:MFS transporter n=1 Tax=Dactylosporangium sp. CS-033363 TaxID=3239935 RepID=UPI003D8EC7F6